MSPKRIAQHHHKPQSPYRCTLERGGDCTLRTGGANRSGAIFSAGQSQDPNGTVAATEKTRICGTTAIIGSRGRGTASGLLFACIQLPACNSQPLLVRPNRDLVFAEIWLEQYFFCAQISRLKELSSQHIVQNAFQFPNAKTADLLVCG
jgi:hypothetical protein